MYKERIKDLMVANKADEDMMTFIEERVNHMVDYVGHVAMMETQIQRLEIQGFMGQDYRDRVERLDSARRSKHEVAMASVTQLNRLAAASDLQPFYDGPVDHAHRADVGDLCRAVVNEYFDDRYARELTASDLLGVDEESAHSEFAASVEALSGEIEQGQALGE